MTHRCKENESQSELLFDDLSNAASNTCDEDEFSDSSNILELSDAIRHRRRLNKKYNTKCKLKMCIYASYCLPRMRSKMSGPGSVLSAQSAVRNVLRKETIWKNTEVYSCE